MSSFPYIEVAGTYGDVGRAIGKQFAARIKSTVTRRRETIPTYSQYLEKSKSYFQITQREFPQYIEELTETAKAAGVPGEELFLISNPEVYTVEEEKAFVTDKIVERCTTTVSFGGMVIVGHNEDSLPQYSDDLYVLKATIGQTTMLGLHYATEIAGGSGAMNSWGLVQCINSLHTIHDLGVPRAFVARAVLECKTLDDAEALIRRISRASGYNHVLVQGTQVRNLETSPLAVAVLQSYGSGFVHTNHFLSAEASMYESFHTENSVLRYEQAKGAIRQDSTIDDVCQILGEVQNGTLATLLFTPQTRSVQIAVGASVGGKFTTYVL